MSIPQVEYADDDSRHPSLITCAICGHQSAPPSDQEMGSIRGNTLRFRDRQFRLWKCPECGTIHATDPVDYADIYKDYPLNTRRLDTFAMGTMTNLLGRLTKAGLGRKDSILDYACGNGVFLDFLGKKGYSDVAGYDPYVPAYATLPKRAGGFDCVVLNDALEHTHDPRAMLEHAAAQVRPGGLLYAGTADCAGVTDMSDLDRHIMRLHEPFHRVIIDQKGLLRLGDEVGLELIETWLRSYMDTMRPFANYRFLDEINGALNHEMDRALDPSSAKAMFTHPKLWFYAFLGYFFPSAYEPAAVWRVADAS